MAIDFCHLHNHTEYSLLDGANRIPDMVARASELGMKSLAISDHGVMFGVMEFAMECKQKGIKPILGVEAYVAPGGMMKKSGREENHSYHLLLLAKDLEGYRNLCQLSSIAALQGYYYKPRIDHDLLRTYSKGVIGTTTCLGSEVNQALLRGDYEEANRIAGMYAEIFGEGNYFVELQDHGLPEQRLCNEGLLKIARDLKLPLIATNDAHYLCKSDSQPHDVLLCIQTGALVADEKRFKFSTDEFYLKSQEEMLSLFPGHPEALENTMHISEMCNVELGKQRAAMPEPAVPEGMDAKSYLRELAEKGLRSRSKFNDERGYDRLNYELEVIGKTNFEDYFLLVRQFAQATRDRGIYFGVRGSAAGSLVSYCIGITDVDPLEYDLTFERFLNPERVSMPDIDMDFEDARRDEIIQWVKQEYGEDRVAQIITFGTLGAKAAIKDCGRVMGYTPQETDRICKTIPTLPGYTIDRSLKEIAEFRQMVQADPKVKTLVEHAKKVEGIARHAGVHAAGVVIAREPLVNYVPLYRSNEGGPVTAFEMGILEKIGLLKMDFLGLSNLTVLARAIKNIERTHGIKVDHRELPEDDPKTYDMLARGETTGVFQLEGGGMTRYVMQLKPQNVRELAAMIALYRPGPMEHIPRFIDTKFGRLKVNYLDERMRSILEETYGVIVYQDQVLKLVQALAGFSLGKADLLRRAMGKKDLKQMESMNVEFMEGCAANGVDKKAAEQVWELLLPFAGYAFNKAHAVCYSILAYQTAYLKANYPVEYMAALMAVYRDKEDRVVACIEDCRRQKIAVLPPDINRSYKDFEIEEWKSPKGHPQGAIRFGLAAIKGVGEGLVEAIIAEREANGPFTHLYEFCERVKPAGINRLALEALIRSGALSEIDSNRNRLLQVAEAALQFADTANKNRIAGQDSLFGESEASNVPSYPAIVLDLEPPNRSESLAMEKEVMGIYISDHPLRGHEKLVQQSSTHACAAVPELEEGVLVKMAGVIANLRTIVTKSTGKKMATLVLEDFTGQCSITAFPATYEKLGPQLIKDQIVQITGRIMHRDRPGVGGEKTVEIRLEDLRPLEATLDLAYAADPGSPGMVEIRLRRATETQMRHLRELIDDHPGSYELMIQILPTDQHAPIYALQRVDASSTFMKHVQELISGSEVRLNHSAELMSASA